MAKTTVARWRKDATARRARAFVVGLRRWRNNAAGRRWTGVESERLTADTDDEALTRGE